MTINASVNFGLTCNETLSDVPDATAPTLQHNGFGASFAINAASTPAGSLYAAFTPTLVSGRHSAST